MINFSKKYLIVFLALSAVLIGFVLGLWYSKDILICKVCAPEQVDFSLFWEAWNKIQDKYIGAEDIDIEKMIYGAISGMVSSLDDPYTVFFTPEENDSFLEDVSGLFEGVGMEVGIRNEQLQIIAPLEGMPAQKAGLRPGDKIIKINGESTSGFTIEEAVSLIRGPKGTEVKIEILREGWDLPKEFIIKRDVIQVPSIKWELKDNDIVYIKIYHFSEHADTDFQRAAFDILKTPAKKIILDLRSNPGGYLEVSQRIAGWFLEKNDIVVIEDFKDKRENKIYEAKGNSRFLDYPMVILINEGTASASEILASALRDNRDIDLIGKTSFGKGSVQELEGLSDKSSLKITIANWLTPNGSLISKEGLKPDFEVELTEEDYNNERDPQLDKALEIIKEID